MYNLNSGRQFLKRFSADQSGTMAVMWVASLGAVVLAIGASYDLSSVQTAKQKSQHSADLFALAAATYIRDNGEQPQTDAQGFVHGVEYKLSDYGININPYSKIIRDEDGAIVAEPTFIVKYNTPEDNFLTVSVSGTSQPTFMSMAGVEGIDYQAEAVTSYLSEDLKDPASIIFILDNSGSMGWTDSGQSSSVASQTRIYSLKQTLISFNEKMNTLTEKTPDVLRTGLYAFSKKNYYNSTITESYDCTLQRQVVVGTEEYVSGTESVVVGQEEVTTRVWVSSGSGRRGRNRGSYEYVTTMQDVYEWVDVYSTRDVYEWEDYDTTCTRTVPDYITDEDGIVINTKTHPEWNVFDDSKIEDMDDYSSTDPRGALRVAYEKMLLEDDIHEDKNPGSTPLKYVILMTDGAISVSGESSTAATQESVALCEDLHDSNVRVYAIGYAITTNSSADNFLKACASPDSYVLASNSDALDAAFDAIGDDIMEEVIRIQS